MRFCTAINCMDGRVQLPVSQYLCARFNAEYVDMITEPGPNAILADRANKTIVESIERRVHISVGHHHSVGIAVVGHHDCAGNPFPITDQKGQTLAAVRYIQGKFPAVPVIGLLVNENWAVVELEDELTNRGRHRVGDS